MICTKCGEKVSHENLHGEYFDHSCFRVKGYSCPCGCNNPKLTEEEIKEVTWFDWRKIL